MLELTLGGTGMKKRYNNSDNYPKTNQWTLFAVLSKLVPNSKILKIDEQKNNHTKFKKTNRRNIAE